MRVRLSLGIAAAVLLPSLLAWAQVAGSIIGRVTDQNGNPLAGVKISARSDTQIGGRKVTYSNTEGAFRLPGLQPGEFEVGASAPRMKQVLQKGVRVSVATPAEIDLMLEVETAVEEVRVVESAPTVSTTAANLKETFDLDYVAALPLDNLPTKVEPFVRLNTPGAGAGDDRYRGATNRQNVFMVEGFSMVNQRYTMKSLATIDAQTAAYGAEYGHVQGAVVNMVTKSGSNKYEFDISTFYEDNRLAPFLDPIDRAAPTSRTAINPGFSGPIIKDKLWFYANLESRYEYKSYPNDPAGLNARLPSELTLLGRGSFKLTWQVTPRNKVSSFTLYNREGWTNQSNGDYGREADATYYSPRMSAFTGLSWESLLTDSLFLRTQVGVQADQDQNIPQACPTSRDCWDVAPVENTIPRSNKLGNYEQINFNKNLGFEVLNTLEWFGHTRWFGEHDLKLVSRFYVRNETTYVGVPGDHKTVMRGQDRDRLIEYYSNDPRYAAEAHRGFFIRDSTGSIFINSISDSIRLGRHWSINPGVALTYASSNTNAGSGSLNLLGVTPSVSAVWDATHDGRTALRASYSQYVDADAVRVSKYALGDQVSRECQWDDGTGTYSKACKWAGGTQSVTFGLPCGPGGDPNDPGCRQRIRLPRMHEITVGAEREVIPGLSLGADLVHRIFTHPYELQETNRIWNPQGSELDRQGGYRNGRAELITDLETSDAARRRYTGITAVARKRAGNVRVQMGYTWSKLEGNVDNGGDNNAWGDIPGRNVYLWGYLQDDRRHDIRGSATWQATRWLSLGTTYSYSSGAPYSRTFLNSVTGKQDDYRARVSINPGVNLNDPGDDRDLRLPDIQRVNLKVAVNFRPLTGQNIEAYADFLNVLNLRTVTAVITDDGPSFGQPKTLMTPMLVRLGARYRY
jgi:hypothetical protein